MNIQIGKSSAKTAPKTEKLTVGHRFNSAFSFYQLNNIYPAIEISYFKWQNYDQDIKGGSIAPSFILPTTFFTQQAYWKFSIGIAYINNVKWYARKLGDNWLFEDKLEYGVILTDKQTISIAFSHYSNAALNKNNDGANILSIGYQLNW